MKWYVFSILLVLLPFCPEGAVAQGSEAKIMLASLSIPAEMEMEKATKTYDLRVQKYQDRWARLIPNTSTLQYAGSMGLLSIGPGWSYGQKNQWETRIMLGYLPKFSGRKANVTFSIRENYSPWSIPLRKSGFSVEPLTCGAYVTTILNSEDFWIKQSDRYPDGYYWFSSRVRINACLGHSVTYHIPQAARKVRNSITFFYEVSTNDFYLIAFATNKTIKTKEIFHLSLGLRTLLF